MRRREDRAVQVLLRALLLRLLPGALVVGVASAPQVTPEPEPAFPLAEECRCYRLFPFLRLIFIQQLP